MTKTRTSGNQFLGKTILDGLKISDGVFEKIIETSTKFTYSNAADTKILRKFSLLRV